MQLLSLPALPLVPRLPHQLMQERITRFYDEQIRSRYFRGMDFAGPQGDPGWFGPGSAVWHVHSHMPALVFGLQCAAYLERFDPSIFWMGVDHSRIVERVSLTPRVSETYQALLNMPPGVRRPVHAVAEL